MSALEYRRGDASQHVKRFCENYTFRQISNYTKHRHQTVGTKFFSLTLHIDGLFLFTPKTVRFDRNKKSLVGNYKQRQIVAPSTILYPQWCNSDHLSF